VAVEAESRKFESRGPLVFLRIFLLRNAPAGNHKLVADLMENGTVSHIHMYLKKEVARGGERTRVLSISFIFSFSPLYR
jgi:hypothetical protein